MCAILPLVKKTEPRIPVSPMILVVDDDRLTRWSLSRILKREGYRLDEAASIAESLTAIDRRRPDLILLDVRLPDGDGFALLKTIRGSHPGLPVVMMTAHANRGTAETALALGACAHLGKPCDPAELLSTVDRALSRNPPA